MKKIRRIFKESRRWRVNPLGFRGRSAKETTSNSECPDTVMFMDEQSIDEAMLRIRKLIRQNEPLDNDGIEEIRDEVIQLTESGNDSKVYTHSQTDSDTTLLCETVIHNKLNVLIMLVEHGVNVNASFIEKNNVDYDLPLHMACCLGREEFVSYLLSQAADPNKVCILRNVLGEEESFKENSGNAYEYAINSDNLSVLRILFHQSHNRLVLPNFLLHKACKAGAKKCVKYLLAIYPEQLAEEDSNGVTPLGHAFWTDPTVAAVLAENDQNHAIQREFESGVMGLTAFEMFMKLCSMHPDNFDREEALKFFFKYVEYDIVADQDGQTGLHHLCNSIRNIQPVYKAENYENTLSSIHLLLAVGADTEKKNIHGEKPLMSLLSTEHLLSQVDPYLIKLNFSFMQRTIKLLLECGASAKEYEIIAEEEIAFMSPLQRLVDMSKNLSDSALIMVHPCIRNIAEDILKYSRSPDAGFKNTARNGPILFQFMSNYLTRLPEATEAFDTVRYEILSDYFAEIIKLFLSHNVNISHNFMLDKRPTNYFKQFMYVLLQDILKINHTRVGVMKSFASVLYTLLRLRKKVDISGFRPDLSGYQVNYQGPDDLPSYFSYLLIGDVNLVSTTGILNLVLESYHVLPREDQTLLKCSLVARLRDADVSKHLIDLVQSHLECLPR